MSTLNVAVADEKKNMQSLLKGMCCLCCRDDLLICGIQTAVADMELNEDASNVSQGQKQLLTIARAILADNPILILDSRQPVGDDKACSAPHQIVKCLLDTDFCTCIYRGCGLIKDKDWIVCKDSSCYCQKLLLSL